MSIGCRGCDVNDPRKRIEHIEDLRKIMALKAVIEVGSLRKAATLLKVTPSAISQAIGGLEKKYGKVMLLRESSGVRPSPEGQALVEKLGPAIELLDQVFDDQAPEQNLKISALDIGVYESLAIGILSQLDSKLRKDFPKIKLSLLASRSSQVVKKIRSGELCFGIVTEADSMEDLAKEKIAEDHLGLFIPKKSDTPNLPLDKLFSRGFGVLTAPSEGWPSYFSRFLRSLGSEWKVGLQSDSFEVLLSAAADGLMPVVLPHRVAARSSVELIDLIPRLRVIASASKKVNDTKNAHPTGQHGIYVVSTLKCDRRELQYLSQILRSIWSKSHQPPP